MALETERKYLHPNLTQVRERLSQKGAVFREQTWEQNLVLDTPDKSLRRKSILLRLRHAERITLTLKKPAPNRTEGNKVKAMEELETVVSDQNAMLGILERLGFEVAFAYEKFRETWQWQKCTICLDTLPFMEAVEVEGDLACIDAAADLFELDNLDASTLSYHQLHQAYRQSHGLPPKDDFCFSREQRARIARMLARPD